MANHCCVHCFEKGTLKSKDTKDFNNLIDLSSDQANNFLPGKVEETRKHVNDHTCHNSETPEHQGHQRQPPDILSGEPVMNGGQSQAPAVAQSMAAAPPPMMIPPPLVQNNSDRNLFMQTGELNATR